MPKLELDRSQTGPTYKTTKQQSKGPVRGWTVIPKQGNSARHIRSHPLAFRRLSRGSWLDHWNTVVAFCANRIC